MNLHDLFDAHALAMALEERLVVARQHPHAPLTILNYTERCQYEKGLWNDVTLQCRGLIHDDSGRVLARPFRKFFNYGQAEGQQIAPDSPVCVTDKLDGSLGILYPIGNGHAIATRGAFTSEQAEHATEVWLERYADHFTPPEGWTMLFEIVYPQNRIVLDYGGRDDLVFLGAVQIASGKTTGPHSIPAWPGPRADTFEYASLADALAAPARQNAEGLVIHCLTTDTRVKVKQEDYVALHRIVTGLNERTVWEHLKNGKPLSEILDAVPDEFHSWVSEVAARLTGDVERIRGEIENAYSTILATLPADASRKDFALKAKEHDLRTFLFARHDQRDYSPGIWDSLYPAPKISPRQFTEDTA